MHAHYSKIFQLVLISVGLLGLQTLALAQTIDLRFTTTLNCATNSYSATIQARAANVSSLAIGNSSILFTYDPASLSFVNYKPLSFNTGVWDEQAFDGNMPGFFNLTLTLLQNNTNNPRITSAAWVDIGTVLFSLINPRNASANPLLAFNVANTNFNSVPANDGTNSIRKGIFAGVSVPGSLSCVTCLDPTIAMSRRSFSDTGQVMLSVSGCTDGTVKWSTGATNTSSLMVVRPTQGTSRYTATCTVSGGCSVSETIVLSSLSPDQSPTCPIQCVPIVVRRLK